jgi:hypothetical protein
MISINLVCCFVGVLALLAFNLSMESVLWCGMAGLGIGLASMFPSGLVFLNQQMSLKLDHNTLLYVVLAATSGEIMFPVAAWLSKDVGRHYVIVVTSATAVCVLLFMYSWRCYVPRHAGAMSQQEGVRQQVTQKSDGYQLAPADEEDGLELSAGSMVALLNVQESDMWNRTGKVN